MIGGTIPLARRLTPLSKKKLMNLYKIYCKVKFKEKRDENVNQINFFQAFIVCNKKK